MAQGYRDNDVAVYDDDRVARPVRRISWGAVLAGTLIALMILLLINLLGVGLGLESIDPATEADPLAGVGTGLSITVIIANLLALFFGGWAAGRLAGNPRTTEGVLHGILVWGLLTLLTFWLLTTAAGRLVSGAASAVGQGLSLVGQGVSAVAPDAAAAVENALSAQGVSLQSIRQEAQGLLNNVGAATGGAGIAGADIVEGEGSVQETVGDAAQNVETTAQDIAQNPQAASAEIDQLLNQLTASGESLADSANRQDLVEALVANTDLSQAEAEARVDNWISTLQNADVNLQGARQELEQAAQNASDALGRAALWAFVGLLVGALIAAIGAAVGSPSNPTQARRA